MEKQLRGLVLRLVVAPISALLAHGATAAAQTLEWTADGVRYHEGLGVAVTSCGDADSDGLPELLIGARPIAGATGKAFVYSSASPHALLLEFDGDAPDDGFGRHVGDLGDVDGDGLGDYAIAAPDRVVTGAPVGAVFVWSGSGALLRTITSSTGARSGWRWRCWGTSTATACATSSTPSRASRRPRCSRRARRARRSARTREP